MLKQFFRDLPDPLFTDSLYPKFIDASLLTDERTKLFEIRNIIHHLPQYHFGCAKYLMEHLDLIAQNEKYTLMNANTLARVDSLEIN